MVAFLLSGSSARIVRGTPGLKFAVLGPVQVRRDDAELNLGSPQQRLTLAVLLLARGRMVHAAEIVSALWAEEEPPSARATVRTYVHRLRRVLSGNGTDSDCMLRSVGNGYQLLVAKGALDFDRFLAARSTAGLARGNGDVEQASRLLREAIGEWGGDALAGLPGEWARSERRRLGHLGFQTAESLAELELESEPGACADLVERLATLAESEPLREHVHELLMLALYRSGRPAEALTTFEHVRAALRDELGVDPGPALRELHEQILRSDAALLSAPPSPAQVAVRPAQMPAPLPVFSGRRAELAELTARMEIDPAPNVVVVHGTAGVGKTTFAIHWATRAKPSYPDGQLYVNLRGFEAGSVAREPEEVLSELLAALGVPSAEQPSGLDALAARYRTALASRRMLVVLDNARSDIQVLPLLPGGTDSLTLITSRLELTGTAVTTGAHAVQLGLLDDRESADLMSRRLGRERVAAEPDAMRAIATACARLPLALAVVSARIARNRRLRLSDIANDLRHHAGSRLDALSVTDPSADLRSLLSWSYNALPEPACRLFRLLSLMPSSEFTLEATASLTALPIRQALDAMRELTRACLVTPQRGRYGWHDLLRDYAGELLEETETADEIRAAQRRLLDHHISLSRAAAAAIDPNNDDQPPPMDIAAGVQPGPVFDDHSARAMLATEYSTVLALIRRADDIGFEQHTWYLAWYLRRFLHWTGRIEDLATCNEIALRAAQRTDDQLGVGYAHRSLSFVAKWRDNAVGAHRHLDHALAAFTAAADHLAQAYVHRQAVGILIDHRLGAGQYDAAFERLEQARALMRAEDRFDLETSLLTPAARILWQAGRTEEAIEAGLIARTRNAEQGRKSDLTDVLDVLAFAHAKLGDHQTAIKFKEERIALITRTDNSGNLVNLRELLAFEMIELISLLLGGNEHARAEATQRELLQRLRLELTDPLFVEAGQAADDLHALLADLDALMSTDQPDRKWYAACEAIFRRAGDVADQAGALRWMAHMVPDGVITMTSDHHETAPHAITPEQRR
ncbi:winged helix-turn-helix domain-containing protein [Lentzea alba]|uniref:AfsR/SARP family transcriptional regulator n=1 Tax=Lentzea alba TaxID=2714351 RepID=UPI0039BF86F3